MKHLAYALPVFVLALFSSAHVWAYDRSTSGPITINEEELEEIRKEVKNRNLSEEDLHKLLRGKDLFSIKRNLQKEKLPESNEPKKSPEQRRGRVFSGSKTIRLVLDNESLEEEVITPGDVFKYRGVISAQETETGYIPEQKIPFSKGKIECETKKGKPINYQFAVFADDDCGYEKADNGCRLIHGLYDVKKKETFYTAIDNAVIRASSMDGVAATRWEVDEISGSKRLEQIHPERLKAIYFCDVGDSFEINFKDSDLSELVKFSPLNFDDNRTISKEDAERIFNEVWEEQEAKEWKGMLKLFVLIVVIFAIIWFVGWLIFRDKSQKKQEKKYKFAFSFFKDEEAERIADEEAENAKQQGQEDSQTEEARAEADAEREARERAEREKREAEQRTSWNQTNDSNGYKYGTKEWAIKDIFEFDAVLLNPPYLSKSEYKKKRKFLSIAFAPDRHPHKEEATKKLQEINLAAEILEKHFKSLGVW